MPNTTCTRSSNTQGPYLAKAPWWPSHSSTWLCHWHGWRGRLPQGPLFLRFWTSVPEGCSFAKTTAIMTMPNPQQPNDGVTLEVAAGGFGEAGSVKVAQSIWRKVCLKGLKTAYCMATSNCSQRHRENWRLGIALSDIMESV